MHELKKVKMALGICSLFFLAYATLSIIRHHHFGSGFDLGVVDQIVWKYSQLKAPITTAHFYPFTLMFTDHLEFIYILLAPFYWIYSSAITLLVLQALVVTSSGIPIYLLAKNKKVHQYLCYALLVSYLLFYGIQQAVWADVHGLAFGAGFLAWFIYFLAVKRLRWTIIFFVITILCKEDMALLTGAVSFVYFLVRRETHVLLLLLVSGVYLLAVYAGYYPYFTQDGYRHQGEGGLLGNVQLSYLYDSAEKREVVLYSLLWFGLLPLLAPLFLIPAIGDLAHYFVFAHTLTASHGLFLHYRVALGVLLVLPTIMAISRFKFLNSPYTAIYVLVMAGFFQYFLHLPMSYLAKQWFWAEPASVRTLNEVIATIPRDASLVSQNNITPHVSQRDLIFTLFPTKKEFPKDSPCGRTSCNWFRWAGEPAYLIVDTSADWDARGFLTDRESFIDGLKNLEKADIIQVHSKKGSTVLYRIVEQ